ncbi:hypothetical protein [Flexivirga oryzae]|uniref:Uncharacterized protein n=1 Tax=Flexivirga oryzae TaxID=1794944 RepID=A0A839N9N5_9MICO|nr:hypothetical protein [Flexivirga oryzae]MBB2893937.1 hypothetical protein [Flexivirga oryzae]
MHAAPAGLAIGTGVLLLVGFGRAVAVLELVLGDGADDALAFEDLVAARELVPALLVDGTVAEVDGSAAGSPESCCSPITSMTPPATAMTAPAAIATPPQVRDRRRDVRVCMQGPRIVGACGSGRPPPVRL